MLAVHLQLGKNEKGEKHEGAHHAHGALQERDEVEGDDFLRAHHAAKYSD